MVVGGASKCVIIMTNATHWMTRRKEVRKEEELKLAEKASWFCHNRNALINHLLGGLPLGLYVWLAWHRLRIDPVPKSIILLAGKTMHDLTDQSHNSPTTVTRGWSILFLLLLLLLPVD